MKILIDMNLPPRLAKLLSDRHIESSHWYHIGAPDASDTELIAYAQSKGYIILSRDLDFSAILSATHGQRPSVVQIRGMDCGPEQIVVLLYDALIQHAEELERGAIMTIDMKKARMRLLPL